MANEKEGTQENQQGTYTACMEIAAAESIPDLGYEPPKSSK
jgi:hypothetical protein